MKRRGMIYVSMMAMVLVSCDKIADEKVGMDITDLTLYISFNQPIMRIYGDEAQLKSFANIYKKANGKAFDFYYGFFYGTSSESERISSFSFYGADAAYSSNSKSSALLHRSQIQHDLEGKSYIEISWQDDIPIRRWWDEMGENGIERQDEETTMTLFSDGLFTPDTGLLELTFESVVRGTLGNPDYIQKYSEVSRDEKGITFGLCEAGMGDYGISNPYFSKCPG